MNNEYDDYQHEVKIDIGGGITIKRTIACDIRGDDSFFCSPCCCFVDLRLDSTGEEYCILFREGLNRCSGEHDGLICCDACQALIKPQIQLAIAQEEYNESLHQD